MTMRTRLLATLTALALVAGLPAGTASAAQDTTAIAVNTRDGSSVFKLKFNIFQVNSDVVDNGNAAVAYASCELCQTVAISIQVLLVASDPSDFEPTNLALAFNESCSLCATLAGAYQFAIGIGERLKFTAEGRRQLAEIRTQLNDLRQSGLSIVEIQDRVDGYMDQLAAVLDTELIGAQEPAGGPAPDAPAQDSPTETAGAPATDQPAPAPAAAETAPATAEPAPTQPAPSEPGPTETTTTETTPTTTETAPTETTPTTTTEAAPTETTTTP